MNVFSVVVTYNRKELLLKNIKAQLSQTYKLKKLIIVDNNSTDGTEDYLIRARVLDNPIVHYLKLSENIGGSGGFYEGTKVAYEMGADAIWLMDDDGCPFDEYTLANMMKEVPNTNEFAINSLVIFNDEEVSFKMLGTYSRKELVSKGDKNVLNNALMPFNGTLVSRALVKEIGYPRRDFFIKGDEVDYKLKIERTGCPMIVVLNSLYFHPQLKILQRKFIGLNLNMNVESPWKEYYRARNYTFMYHRNGYNVAILIELLFLKVLSILLSKNKQKIKCIRLVSRGIIDGLRNKMGRTVLPG